MKLIKYILIALMVDANLFVGSWFAYARALNDEHWSAPAWESMGVLTGCAAGCLAFGLFIAIAFDYDENGGWK